MTRARLALFYVAFFFAWGCVLPYWPVWYESRGLSPQMIGVAGGVGLMARMLISPIAAFWSDGRPRAKDSLVALSWATLAFFAAHVPARDPALLVVLAFATGAALYPIIPLSDSLAVREARRGGFAFGPVRAVGSSAFIVANLGAGALIGRLGGEAMLGWMIAACLLMAGVSHLLPPGVRDSAAQSARERMQALRTLLRRPDFLLALFGAGLISGSHGFYYSFSSLAWRAEGHSTAMIGALWGTGVAAEIVFFALSARVRAWLSPLGLMGVGAVAAIVRWLALAASPALPVLFALQTLHALSFAAVFLSFVLLADRMAGERQAATALALNSALSGGAFSALSTAASGWLFAHYGASAFAAMAAPAAIGGLFALALALRKDGAPPAQPHSAGEGIPIEAPL